MQLHNLGRDSLAQSPFPSHVRDFTPRVLRGRFRTWEIVARSEDLAVPAPADSAEGN